MAQPTDADKLKAGEKRKCKCGYRLWEVKETDKLLGVVCHKCGAVGLMFNKNHTSSFNIPPEAIPNVPQ